MSDVQEFEAAGGTTDVAIVTTTEVVCVSTDPLPITRDTNRVLIFGWAQVTSGAGATALTPRIRRGPAITDTLVDEANAQAVAASANDRILIMVVDDDPGDAPVRYSLTVQQTGATGNGNVTQAAIFAIAF